MKYELLLLAAAALFSLQFLLQDRFQRVRGTGLSAALEFSMLSDAVIFLCMLLMQGFRFEFTWFSALIGLLAAACGILGVFCGLRALEKADLAVYSVYEMLGGMLLPFLLGCAVYREAFTVRKLAACALIAAALALTAEHSGTGAKDSGRVYYAAVFVLNGMSGVFSKIHQSSSLAHVSSNGYMELKSAIAVLLAAAAVLIFRVKFPKPEARAVLPAAGYALLCGAGNLLLLIALLHVPASVQYPLVTGGVIVFSFLIVLARGQRLTKRKVAALILSLISTVLIAL